LLVDARSVEDSRTLEADLCIVGAGAAGIALALELVGRPLRVLLLESGGFEPEPETQALYRGRVFGRPYFRLDSARTRRFGGSTNCWLGLCRPLDPIDFEVRDWVPHSGWPFDRAHLDPFYARAHDTCRLEDPVYDGSSWASAERPALPFVGGSVSTRNLQIAPVRFGRVHRDRVTSARNVQTVLFANAVEIVANEAASAVERVRVATLSGRRFDVRARAFVLATGGIENPRLLLASNGVQREGLGNGRGLVGRFFMEHPRVVSGAWLPSSDALRLGLYRPHPRGRVENVALLTVSDATLRSERMLSFASLLAREAELPEFEVSLARMVHEMDAAPGGPADRASFLLGECEQAPNPESRVRLVEERDALGMPRVQLEWRLSALDKRSLRRGHEILARELARAGLGRLQQLLSEDDHRWPEELAGGRHHMGTTRMHADPARGVVDADCRLHGVSNLYVAGSSVFPTGGAASPTLTIVALALRLADHLRQVLA
jgi:choline dehydrogenase-like flavoprotein